MHCVRIFDQGICLGCPNAFKGLTVSGIMMKNSQTYFKNLAVFTEQDFSSIFNDYSSLSIIGLGWA